MNILDVLDYMQENWYSAITIKYQKDGVRTIKLWSEDSSSCKTMIYDPRWDSKKKGN